MTLALLDTFKFDVMYGPFKICVVPKNIFSLALQINCQKYYKCELVIVTNESQVVIEYEYLLLFPQSVLQMMF